MWFFCLKGVCRDLRFLRCKSLSWLGYRIMLVPHCSRSYSWYLGIITHSASFTLEVSLRVVISFIDGKREKRQCRKTLNYNIWTPGGDTDPSGLCNMVLQERRLMISTWLMLISSFFFFLSGEGVSRYL